MSALVEGNMGFLTYFQECETDQRETLGRECTIPWTYCRYIALDWKLINHQKARQAASKEGGLR